MSGKKARQARRGRVVVPFDRLAYASTNLQAVIDHVRTEHGYDIRCPSCGLVRLAGAAAQWVTDAEAYRDASAARNFIELIWRLEWDGGPESTILVCMPCRQCEVINAERTDRIADGQLFDWA